MFFHLEFWLGLANSISLIFYSNALFKYFIESRMKFNNI